MLLDGAKMIRERVAGGFAGLGHQIGDVDARGFGFGDGAGDFRDQQIGQDAGVERAGAQENEVGLLDGFDDRGKQGARWRGESLSFLMGARLAVMRVSPWTTRPFSSVATRCTFESVDGKMRPRMARTLLLTRMASVKSPVTCVSAARKRLPKLWPMRPRPA